MGSPQGAGGHSVEWQSAYLTAAPEDRVQNELLSQLALPVGAAETREQARRVDTLRTLFSGLDANSANRLFERLSSPRDSLGLLFHLTLHHTTRKSLIDLLGATRHSHERGVAPGSRATNNRKIPPPSQRTTPKLTQTPDPGGAGPRWEPPQIKRQEPEREPPIIVPPQAPLPPWRPPGDVIPPLDEPSDAGGPQGWVWKLVDTSAKLTGAVLSKGIRVLGNPTILAAMGAGILVFDAAGVEAAWTLFQTAGEATLESIFGAAGEAAAEAILPKVLGISPTQVINLNRLVSNFPLVDIATRRGLFSVKVYGVASRLKGKALSDALVSRYTSDLLEIAVGGPRGDRKLARAAQLLLNNRAALMRKDAWPADLRATTVDGVSKYLREKILFSVPDDHVGILQRDVGQNIYGRHKRGLGIWRDGKRLTEDEVIKLTQDTTARIRGIGVTTGDLTSLLLATDDLPKTQRPAGLKKFKGKDR